MQRDGVFRCVSPGLQLFFPFFRGTTLKRETTQLSEKAKVAIKKPENEILVSIVSYWEISLKYALDKLELQGIVPEELPKKAKEISIETLEISEEEAGITRRQFLTKALRISFGAFAGIQAISWLGFMWPKVSGGLDLR